MSGFQHLITLYEQEQEMGYGAGVCIFCPKTGRFLLQKRGPRVDDPGEHDWFGGGVDDGEDILTGAIRELEEEGGIKAEPESLYPLARFGYQPEKGLGGYHIYLLVVADEFEPCLNYDADSHDEVSGADWIGTNEWSSIKPHERVWVLFSDPEFVETLKNATRDRVESKHVAKLSEGRLVEVDLKQFAKGAALAGMIGLGAAGPAQATDFNISYQGDGTFQVTSELGTFSLSKEERNELVRMEPVEQHKTLVGLSQERAGKQAAAPKKGGRYFSQGARSSKAAF